LGNVSLHITTVVEQAWFDNENRGKWTRDLAKMWRHQQKWIGFRLELTWFGFGFGNQAPPWA